MNSRKKILQNITSALKTPSHVVDDPDDQNLDTSIRERMADLAPTTLDGLVEQFKKELDIVSGEFISVASENEAVQFVKRHLDEHNERQISFAGSGLSEKIATQLENINVVNPKESPKIETLAEINTSVVDVEYALAESATLVIPLNKTNSSMPHFLPDTVIALVRKNQIIAHQFELFEKIDSESARNMLFVTGPSRTADIEKILILGAHGPRRLIVIMIN